MLRKLKAEIRKRVEAAIAAKASAEIAGIKVSVTDLSNEQVYICVDGEALGRVSTKSWPSANSATAMVFSAVKARFREEGPGAALKAVIGD